MSELVKKETTLTFLEDGQFKTIDVVTGQPVGKPRKFKEVNGYKYSEDFAFVVCQFIREGMTLTDICKQPGFPSYRKVCYWKKYHPEFSDMIKEAKRDRAELLNDEVIDISRKAKNGHYAKEDVAAVRLAKEGFETAAGHDDPKTYGKAKDQAPIQINNFIWKSNIPDEIPGYRGEKEVKEIDKDKK